MDDGFCAGRRNCPRCQSRRSGMQRRRVCLVAVVLATLLGPPGAVAQRPPPPGPARVPPRVGIAPPVPIRVRMVAPTSFEGAVLLEPPLAQPTRSGPLIRTQFAAVDAPMRSRPVLEGTPILEGG